MQTTDFIIPFSYLETGGTDAIIQPWFWILWLLAGPIIRSVYFQWYIFIAMRTSVRAEGLLTQLVFKHSFRIRLKSGASDLSQASGNSSSDSQSTSKARVNGKDKDDPSTFKSDDKQASKGKKDADNLIGKINNLVTTDLANIVGGRDFLVISTLHSFRLRLDLSSDTPTSFIFPTSNNPVHHILIQCTWMEVSLSSYVELKA